MTEHTPIDRAALALVPLLVAARPMLRNVRGGSEAEDQILDAFEALWRIADNVSYRLLLRSRYDNEAAELMAKIDEAAAEMQAIEYPATADAD